MPTAATLWTPALLPAAIAFAWLAVASVVLTIIDVRTRRLPDRIVLPGYVVGAAAFALAALFTGDPAPLVRAAAGAVVMFGFFLLLRILSRAGMGGGDVKLAGVLGLFLGWAGWDALIVGLVAAFLLGGLYSAALLLAGRASSTTAVPFGPFLLGGAWIGIGVPLALALSRAA
jgi:leader peptidase (prepilin peptidase) / N-methyltransferase